MINKIIPLYDKNIGGKVWTVLQMVFTFYANEWKGKFIKFGGQYQFIVLLFFHSLNKIETSF